MPTKIPKGVLICGILFTLLGLLGLLGIGQIGLGLQGKIQGQISLPVFLLFLPLGIGIHNKLLYTAPAAYFQRNPPQTPSSNSLET